MRMARGVQVAVAALVVLCPLAGALGQGGDIDLQKALDKPVDLNITDAPVKEVFARLAKATGVRFAIDPLALERLPYGEQTRVAVRIPGMTLRKALSPMLSAQGLQWAVDGAVVRIYPGEPLARMGRRATYDELKALASIHSGRLKPAAAAGTAIEQIRKITGNRDLKISSTVGDVALAKAIAAAHKALPATAAAWLDALCRAKQWTWYLWGDEIRIIPKAEQVERQLQRQVSLRYRGASLDEVLLDLARKARAKLEIAPGALGYLRAGVRDKFTLVMAEATIAEALEVIAGASGLKFVVSDAGLRVEASASLVERATTRPSRKRSAFFVKMSIPGPDGISVEVFLRSDDLPEDVVRAIQVSKERLIERIRSTLPPAPTTQPTTQPSRP